MNRLRGTICTALALLLIAGCGSSDGGPTTGDLLVIVATAGTAIDADGYSVTVTGSTPFPLPSRTRCYSPIWIPET